MSALSLCTSSFSFFYSGYFSHGRTIINRGSITLRIVDRGKKEKNPRINLTNRVDILVERSSTSLFENFSIFLD